MSLPILHPYPSLFTPPSSVPAEQRQLLFVSYILCPRLGVRLRLFNDAGGRDTAVCVSIAAEMEGVDNVRPCAY